MLRRLLLVTAAAAMVISCQQVQEEMPSAPNSPSPAPIPIIIVSASPSAAPTPAATPTPPLPTPTPGPGPAPTPTPPARACTLPPGGGTGNNCPRGEPSFLSVVEEALDQLVREEPALFDLDKTRGCGNCYYVSNPTRYASRLTQLVQARGFCAFYDGEELAIKNSNQFNDQFDILTSDLYIRRQLGSYRATCSPAWF